MIDKIIDFLKNYKPSREWRLPYLLLVSTIPPTLITHFASVKYGINVGVTIGFFCSIPIVCYTCWKIFMDDWLGDD